MTCACQPPESRLSHDSGQGNGRGGERKKSRKASFPAWNHAETEENQQRRLEPWLELREMASSAASHSTESSAGFSSASPQRRLESRLELREMVSSAGSHSASSGLSAGAGSGAASPQRRLEPWLELREWWLRRRRIHGRRRPCPWRRADAVRPRGRARSE